MCRALHIGRKPTANKASAGYYGKIIDVPQQIGFLQRLQDTQVESRAADAATGKRQPHQIVRSMAGL